jgi:hypothetical protein
MEHIAIEYGYWDTFAVLDLMTGGNDKKKWTSLIVFHCCVSMLMEFLTEKYRILRKLSGRSGE